MPESHPTIDLVEAFGLDEDDFRGFVRDGDLTVENVDQECAKFVSAMDEARMAGGEGPSPVSAAQLADYVRRLIAEEGRRSPRG